MKAYVRRPAEYWGRLAIAILAALSGTGFSDCDNLEWHEARCGDGTIDQGELCDDGNTDPCVGDCSSDCKQYTGCGDGEVCDGEQCDDANALSDDGCSDTCVPEPGYVCAGSPSVCASCGNQKVEGYEVCDDGNTDPCLGDCNADCTRFAGCGDGALCGTESCDDGNDVSEDGCSGTCAVEPAYACDGSPSVCVLRLLVNGEAPEGGDGATWATAYRFLQDAFFRAARQGLPVEIWVASGTYRPDQGSQVELRDWEASFALAPGMRVYGGFAGTEDIRDERDPVANLTTLSGDLQGDDLPDFQNRVDNSCHVLKAIGLSQTTVLDGLVVTGGNALDCASVAGGGLLIENATVDLTNVRFLSNAGACGGGVWAISSEVRVLGCAFVSNRAELGGGLSGFTSRLQVSDCLFQENTAVEGGGVYVGDNEAAASLVRSKFLFNSAQESAGARLPGLNDWHAVVPVIACTFVGNVAQGLAGGLHGGKAISSIFVGNQADVGGGACNGAVYGCTFFGNSATYGAGVERATAVGNSVFWHNSPDQVHGIPDTRAVTYSCIEGGYSGTGNIPDCDPGLVDPSGADGIPGTLDDDLRLKPDSVCIDAGSNALIPPDELDLDDDGDTTEPVPSDLLGNPRFFDRPEIDTGNGTAPIVDIGAYEMP